MQLLLVALFSALALFLIIWFSVLRVALELRATGQASGAWALAFGLELGLFQVAGVLRQGAPARADLHFLGRRFSLTGRRARSAEPGKSARVSKKREQAAKSRFPAWLDPIDAALFVLDERRHLRIERLVLDLDYGFRDVALTGRLAGALYVLSAVLPERIEIQHRPNWQGAEAWQAHVEGKFALWPGLVLVEVLWYMLRARLRRRQEPAPLAARGTAA